MRVYAWHAFWRGEPELRILSQLMDPQKEAIDVGANYGVYTYHLARFASRVHAYEPNPDLAARLCKSVPANVAIYEVALSDSPGAASLHIPLYADGRHMHGCARIVEDSAGSGGVVHPVRLTRLDDAGYMNIGLIKIDVEGHEEKVIRGATGLIERCKPNLLIEIEQRHLNNHVEDVIGYIESLGYKAFYLKRDGRVACERWCSLCRRKLEPVLLGVVTDQAEDIPINFIFIHSSRLSDDDMSALLNNKRSG